jgi:hypothetical protein
MPIAANEQLYIVPQTDKLIVANTSGVPAFDATHQANFVSFSLQGQQSRIQDPSKTGSSSPVRGTLGRGEGSGTINMRLKTQGTAGAALPSALTTLWKSAGFVFTPIAGTVNVTSASNASPIVVTANAHGIQEGDWVFITGVTGNSAANGPHKCINVTTNTVALLGTTGNGAYVSGGVISKAAQKGVLTSEDQFFSVHSLFAPDNEIQETLVGGLVTETQVNLGGDAAELQFTLGAHRTLDSASFGAMPAEDRCGLSSMPVPSQVTGTPPTYSSQIPGYKGAAILSGGRVVNLVSSTITVRSGKEYITGSGFGIDYPTRIRSNKRSSRVSFELSRQNDAAYKSFLANNKLDIPYDCYFAVGKTPGSTVVFELFRCGGNAPTRNEQDDIQDQFQDVEASASGLSAQDEMRVWFL